MRSLRSPVAAADAVLRHESAGFLLSKITFDAQQIQATASEAITVSIRNALTIVFMLGYLLYMNWQLTLISFVSFPAGRRRAAQDHKRLKRVSVLVQERMGALTHALEEAIGAHRVVKVFGGERYESERLRAASNRLRLAMVKQSVAAALGTPINQIIVSLAVGVILWIALRSDAPRHNTAPAISSPTSSRYCIC